MITVDEMAKRAFLMAKAKGFKAENPDIDRALLLAVGEICEAQNELRNGHSPTEIYYKDPYPYTAAPAHDKPEGFPIEIADAVIRLAQLAHGLGIDLEAAILQKMAYNETRQYKHGKEF